MEVGLQHHEDPPRPRRSVIYVPASNERAVASAGALRCDAVILDLEDSVAADAKPQARERAAAAIFFRPPAYVQWSVYLTLA